MEAAMVKMMVMVMGEVVEKAVVAMMVVVEVVVGAIKVALLCSNMEAVVQFLKVQCTRSKHFQTGSSASSQHNGNQFHESRSLCSLPS